MCFFPFRTLGSCRFGKRKGVALFYFWMSQSVAVKVGGADNVVDNNNEEENASGRSVPLEGNYFYSRSPDRRPSLYSQVTTIQKAGMALVTGRCGRSLAKKVAKCLEWPLYDVTSESNSAGEIHPKFAQHVTDCDVYFIHSMHPVSAMDVNDSVLELLFMIRRMKLQSAKQINAVVPYLAYSRRDRKKDDSFMDISASAIAEMLVQAGVNRVVTVDLHSGQIQGFFDRVPTDNLLMCHEFAFFLSKQEWFSPNDVTVISPDVSRAKMLADILLVPHVATIIKRRQSGATAAPLEAVGDVKGRSCVLIDDLVDTGGTLVSACELLRSLGAVRVVACCTHGICTSPCAERINSCSIIEALVVSDSVPQSENLRRCEKLHVISVAPLLAAAICCAHAGLSVSGLFQGPIAPCVAKHHSISRRQSEVVPPAAEKK